MEQEPRLEASPEREKIAECINQFRSLKDDWKDEIPSELIYGGQIDKKQQMYKCRKIRHAIAVFRPEINLPLVS